MRLLVAVLSSALLLASAAPPPAVVHVPGGSVTLGECALPLPAALTRGLSSRALGDYDESPWAPAASVGPLLVLATEVTNAQFEDFQPAHAALRGKDGFSALDEEAAVFVTWYDAAAYCTWLAAAPAGGGAAWRLPSETEAEYLIKAGADASPFPSGDSLPAAAENRPEQASSRLRPFRRGRRLG